MKTAMQLAFEQAEKRPKKFAKATEAKEGAERICGENKTQEKDPHHEHQGNEAR